MFLSPCSHILYTRAIQLQIQYDQILKPENVDGPDIFNGLLKTGSLAFGIDKF